MCTLVAMKRLEQIKALIRSRIGVIDVGTDHAFLPISLALAGYAGNLIASDIHPLPLQAAVKNAQIRGVRDRIVFRLSDGLDACHPEEVDTVILAGMGGDLICSILDRAEWTMDCEKQLLLQPLTKAEILRFWLYNNGYVIERECPVLENGRIFQIMSVRYMNQNTSVNDAELYLGKCSMHSDVLLYREQALMEANRLRKKADGLQQTGASAAARGFYQNIVRELCNLAELKQES